MSIEEKSQKNEIVKIYQLRIWGVSHKNTLFFYFYPFITVLHIYSFFNNEEHIKMILQIEWL